MLTHGAPANSLMPCFAGTVEYLELIANFARVHLGTALSNLERVEFASDVLNDLRFWRNHLYYTP